MDSALAHAFQVRCGHWPAPHRRRLVRAPRALVRQPPGHKTMVRERVCCARVCAPVPVCAPVTPEQGASAFFSLQLGPWATAGPSHASSFQDPPPRGKPAVFRHVLAHIMRPRPRPRLRPCPRPSLSAGPGRATSFQDPPPCGKPAAFRRVPAHHAPACMPALVRVPARRPNKAPRRFSACSSGLGRRGPEPRHLLQDPPPCGKPAVFRPPAHRAPASTPALVRVPARHPNKSPHAHQPSAQAWATAGPSHAISFQDPPPCGKPAAFRRGPARIMRPRARPSSSASPRDA